MHLSRTQLTVLALLLVSGVAMPGGMRAEDDFERRAAQAALTERGFYETGGARDTSVPALMPAARVPDHIAEADRKVAEREAARRAAERAAELSEVARLVDQLEASRVHHSAILRGLHEQRSTLAAELDGAQQSGAKDRVRTLQSQLAAVDEAFVTKQNEIARYETRLTTEIVKAQAEPRAAEEARRVAEATALASRLRTKEAQIEAGNAAFEEQLLTIDAAIAQAQSNGLEEVAQSFATARRKTVDAQQAFLAVQEASRATFRGDLDRAYAANRADGIGPTNTLALESSIRRAAIATGGDPATAVNLVDRSAVDSTAASAARVASGAPASTEHVSIFNEVNSESLRDFALDYAAEARVTYGSWEGFKGRVLEGYVAGVGKGTLDAVKGLFDVVVGLGDLTGEALEDALERMTGAELDVFGDDKMRVVRDLLESGARLYGDDDQASREEARKFLATAEAIQTLLRRKTEQMAGSGEKGIREAINLVGQAAPQVLGAEELAVRGAAAAARLAGTGARVVTGVGKADAAVDAARATEFATDASRSGDAATSAVAAAAPPARGVTGGGPETPAGVVTPGTGPDAPGSAPRTGPDDTPTALGNIDPDDSPTALPGARGAVDQPRATTGSPPARAPPLQAAAVLIRPDGSATLKMADGRDFPLGKELGRGSTTTVYEVPGRDGIVVKVTTGGADALDDAGYKIIKGLDPHGDVIEVPTIHRQYEGTAIRSIDGADTGVVTVTDKAPTDFKRATDIQKPGGGMTPGQISAYRRAMDKLNDQGFVWLDSKNDNYTFRRVSGADGDEWKLVIVDPGGIVPMKGRDADAARALQRALDTPSERARTTSRQFDQHRLKHMEELGERFDDLVDWEAIRRLTGKDYRTLGKDYEDYSEVFPFNPKNGFDYPELSAALDAPLPAPPAGAARTATGAGPAPPGGVDRSAPTALDGSSAVDRDAPTALDTDSATSAPPPAPIGAPIIVTGPGADGVPTVRTPGAGFSPDDLFPFLTGAAGGVTGLALGGGFGVQQVLQPIFFEFGGGSVPVPPAVTGLARFFGSEFLVEVEQVYHVTGNNPFDPRDPLAEEAGQIGRIGDSPVVPRPPGPRPEPPPGGGGGGSPPPPGNPFTGSVGSYSGSGGCGVNSTSFATQGTNAIRLTIAPNGGVPFDIVPGSNQADSRSSNLIIFGSPGHSCEARSILDTNFQLFCSNTGGGTCSETFSR